MKNFPRSMFEAAQAYVAAGLSVIPIDPNPTKKPAYRIMPVSGNWPDGRPRRGWSPFMQRRPTQTELIQWFDGWGSMAGIAVVCGQVSGNLEVIDIDSPEFVTPWIDLAKAQAPQLVEKLVLVRTPRPGLHIYFRCPHIGRNEKVATIAVPTEDGSGVAPKVIIETRSEGGYAIIPPTPPYCHPTGRAYMYCSPRSLADVQTITPEERSLLMDISKSFHAPPVRSYPTPRRPVRCTPRPQSDRRRPGDDFNYKAHWDELLERHGWLLSCVTSDGTQHWTRPGKSDGTSATVNYADNDLLHVFTSSVLSLDQDTSYSKFAFLTLMEYAGDYEAAAHALRQQGYGHPTISAGRRGRRQNEPSVAKRSSRTGRRRRTR